MLLVEVIEISIPILGIRIEVEYMLKVINLLIRAFHLYEYKYFSQFEY